MLTLNFTIEISVIQEDEEHKIEKLEEHKRIKQLILKIAEKEVIKLLDFLFISTENETRTFPVTE